MAIYYLSPTGLAVPPYDTWEKAANNLNQILNLDLTGENTIYVAEGTYSGGDNYIQLNNIKFNNLSIVGRGNKANIIFKSNTYYNCLTINTASINNIIFKNITIKREGSGNACYISTGHNIQFISCNIVGDNATQIFYIKSDASVSLCRCFVQYTSYSNSYPKDIKLLEDASLTINYSVFYSPNGSPWSIISHESTGSLHVNNSILGKAGAYLLYQSGSGDSKINNSIFIGAAWSGSSTEVIYKTESAGACDIANSVILPNTLWPKVFTTDNTNLQNVIFKDPIFESFNIKGFIIPRVDDTGNVAYATSLADILAEYGYKGTYFLTTNNADTVANALRSLLQEGVMEIASHTYSHTNLTYDHALHFEYTGSDANPTVELDTSRIIHLKTDGTDDVDIDTTQDNADTLGEIISNFSGTNNWTISYSTTDGQLSTSIRASCKAESLAETVSTSAPCDIDFLKETNCEDGNCKGFYKTEIYEPRFDLTNIINGEGNIVDPQTGQIYEARTFVPPYGAGDASVVDALRTSGYLGAGGIDSFQKETIPYNVFKISQISTEALIVEGNEEQTTKNAELFAINVAVTGLAVTVLAHDETEATLEEWRWILNGFKRAQRHYKLQITSLQLAIEALKKLGTYDPSTGDVDIYWSMPSFRLRHDSPCIDAGKKLPIHDENWQDLAENKIHYGSAPDIGCYEKKTWPLGAWGVLPWIGGRHKVQWTPYEE